MRKQATLRTPIWLATHSESVVRALRLEELILVDKVDGRIRMKSADSGRLTQVDLAPLGLDEVWLFSLLDGGLPWDSWSRVHPTKSWWKASRFKLG